MKGKAGKISSDNARRTDTFAVTGVTDEITNVP